MNMAAAIHPTVRNLTASSPPKTSASMLLSLGELLTKSVSVSYSAGEIHFLSADVMVVTPRRIRDVTDFEKGREDCIEVFS